MSVQEPSPSSLQVCKCNETPSSQEPLDVSSAVYQGICGPALQEAVGAERCGSGGRAKDEATPWGQSELQQAAVDLAGWHEQRRRSGTTKARVLCVEKNAKFPHDI
mmetsp:Transcript_29136/g.46757  ORF Transcript_29136/g.46757 Transcript_29136/m.46757 type:complete len:106 (-) Transcript_29136:5894-6211(-)